MGYYTSFSLEISALPSNTTSPMEQPDAIKNILVSARDLNENIAYALDDDGSPRDAVKWYDYATDMCEISKIYPEWLFTLEGEGEESGDLWKAYFVNGKMQKAVARITYEEFDPLKLV